MAHLFTASLVYDWLQGIGSGALHRVLRPYMLLNTSDDVYRTTTISDSQTISTTHSWEAPEDSLSEEISEEKFAFFVSTSDEVVKLQVFDEDRLVKDILIAEGELELEVGLTRLQSWLT